MPLRIPFLLFLSFVALASSSSPLVTTVTPPISPIDTCLAPSTPPFAASVAAALRMTRFLITFNNRDDNLKISVASSSLISLSARELKEMIMEMIQKKDPQRRLEVDKIEIYHPEFNIFEEITDNISSLISNLNYVHVLVTEKVISSSTTLQIEGRAFNLPEGIEINGMILPIQELSEGREQGTGLNTWDGAVVLAKYLETRQGRLLIENKYILEVGAGTGTAGLASLYLGSALAALSDLEYTLQNLQFNTHKAVDILRASKLMISSQAVVMPLDWSNTASYFYPSNIDPSYPTAWDVILGADIVWLDHLVRPLVLALKVLSSPSTLILLSHQVRIVNHHPIAFRPEVVKQTTSFSLN